MPRSAKTISTISIWSWLIQARGIILLMPLVLLFIFCSDDMFYQIFQILSDDFSLAALLSAAVHVAELRHRARSDQYLAALNR